MLAVERVERSEEPLGGRLRATGEANELCRLDWAGVSLIEGVPVFFGLPPTVLVGVLRSV
jgi:hypothetical protein